MTAVRSIPFALAGILLAPAPAPAGADSAALTRAVAALEGKQAPLRTAYTALILGHRKAGSVANQVAVVAAQIDILDAEILRLAGMRQEPVLREQKGQLQGQKHRLEADLAAKRATLTAAEEAFRSTEGKCLEEINGTLVPILADLTPRDKADVAAVLAIFNLFALDDHRELAGLRLGASVTDQPVLRAAGECIARGGVQFIPELKRALGSTMGRRYTAVIALGELGPAALKADGEVGTALFRLSQQVGQAALERPVREARLRIIQEASAKLRP